jgi:N-hydroxyarylamine O-acetyltransferase
MSFETEPYLRRIGLAEAPRPDVDGLRALQRAQAMSIPFENFDILLERGIALEPEAVFAKLVRRPRGGYCFEVNGLLLAALQAFGFEARPLLGRVHMMGEPTGRSHQISLVRIDGADWIADAGFGGATATEPMKLVLDEPVELAGSVRRFVEDPLFGVMLQLRGEGGWTNLYSFDLEHVTRNDRLMGNHFMSTHPDSFFTWARVAARPTPEGRVTLVDFKLRRVERGVETVETLAPGAPYLEALRRHFGIELDAPYEALRPTRDGHDLRI